MAFSSCQQAKNYISFSTISDLENGRKAPQTATPRFYSSHPFFSLHRKDMPQNLITQKFRSNDSFTRYFSQTMFPQTSEKGNNDIAFSTFPMSQNSLKYPSPRMPRFFQDAKLSGFHLKSFESICEDKNAKMQQSEKPADAAASLPEQIPQALFPFRAHKRRKQALNKCDAALSTQTDCDLPEKKRLKMFKPSDIESAFEAETKRVQIELADTFRSPQFHSLTKVKSPQLHFEGCNCKPQRITTKKLRIGCKGRRTYVSYRCENCKQEWSSCPNNCGSMCQWDDNTFMQCKNCFVKLNQKIIPWPWPYQWIRCPGCSAQYVYDKKVKYPREAKECKLLAHNPQTWAPKIKDKNNKNITDSDNADPKPFNMQFDADSPKFPFAAKIEPPETLLHAPPLLELDPPAQLSNFETKVKIEGSKKPKAAPRISILADVAINFSMLVGSSSQDSEEVSNTDSADCKEANSTGRPESESVSTDSATTGSPSESPQPNSSSPSGSPERKSSASSDEACQDATASSEASGSVQPALWLQNKYERNDEDGDGTKPSLEKIRLSQIKRGLPTRATARVKRLVQKECARLLWKFFTQALTTTRMNVEHTLRMILHLSLSFEDCRPFAREPGPGSSTAHRQWDHKRGPQWRLQQIKNGSKLPELTVNASHSSLAEDKRNIKTECGRLIWYVIHEAEAKMVVNPQEVLELRHMVVGLRNKTRAPTWGKLELGDHLVELKVDDPIKARRTANHGDVLEHARITHVQQDATTGVRSYTLLFSDGFVREGVSRRQLQTISLNIGNSVLVKPKKDSDWERARIKAVHTDKSSGVRLYDVEIDTSKTLVSRVSVQDLRVRDPRLQVRRNARERDYGGAAENHADPAPSGDLNVGYGQDCSESAAPFGVKIDVVLRVPHGGRVPI